LEYNHIIPNGIYSRCSGNLYNGNIMAIKMNAMGRTLEYTGNKMGVFQEMI
jgi:hypothetical protein